MDSATRCPQVLGSRDDGHAYVLNEEIPAELLNQAHAVVLLCPEEALRIEEDSGSE